MPGYGVAAGWDCRSEGCHFYHLDEQNSTAYITGQSGTVVNRYQYDAFGQARSSVEGFKNRILYTGQQYDAVTGQYYLRARFYHPEVGRFLQEDVYRGDGLNLYAYCANNPVIFYDPSGYVIHEPNVEKLESGSYRYPDRSIRDEKGHYAGYDGIKSGDMAVEAAMEYYKNENYDVLGREVTVRTSNDETRRYDLAVQKKGRMLRLLE